MFFIIQRGCGDETTSSYAVVVVVVGCDGGWQKQAMENDDQKANRFSPAAGVTTRPSHKLGL